MKSPYNQYIQPQQQIQQTQAPFNPLAAQMVQHQRQRTQTQVNNNLSPRFIHNNQYPPIHSPMLRSQEFPQQQLTFTPTKNDVQLSPHFLDQQKKQQFSQPLSQLNLIKNDNPHTQINNEINSRSNLFQNSSQILNHKTNNATSPYSHNFYQPISQNLPQVSSTLQQQSQNISQPKDQQQYQQQRQQQQQQQQQKQNQNQKQSYSPNPISDKNQLQNIYPQFQPIQPPPQNKQPQQQQQKQQQKNQFPQTGQSYPYLNQQEIEGVQATKFNDISPKKYIVIPPSSSNNSNINNSNQQVFSANNLNGYQNINQSNGSLNLTLQEQPVQNKVVSAQNQRNNSLSSKSFQLQNVVNYTHLETDKQEKEVNQIPTKNNLVTQQKQQIQQQQQQIQYLPLSIINNTKTTTTSNNNINTNTMVLPIQQGVQPQQENAYKQIEEIQKLKSKLMNQDEEILEFRKKIEELSSYISKNTPSQVNQCVQDLIEENDKLVGMIQEKEEIISKNNQYKEQNEKLKEENNLQKQQLEQFENILQNQRETDNNKYQMCLNELEQEKNKNSSLIEAYQQLEERVNILEREKNDLLQNKHSSDHKISILIEQNQKFYQENEEDCERCSDLERTLKKQIQNIVDLEKQMNVIKNSLKQDQQ